MKVGLEPNNSALKNSTSNLISNKSSTQKTPTEKWVKDIISPSKVVTKSIQDIGLNLHHEIIELKKFNGLHPEDDEMLKDRDAGETMMMTLDYNQEKSQGEMSKAHKVRAANNRLLENAQDIIDEKEEHKIPVGLTNRLEIIYDENIVDPGKAENWAKNAMHLEGQLNSKNPVKVRVISSYIYKDADEAKDWFEKAKQYAIEEEPQKKEKPEKKKPEPKKNNNDDQKFKEELDAKYNQVLKMLKDFGSTEYINQYLTKEFEKKQSPENAAKIGNLYLNMNDDAKAIEYYNKMKKLDPAFTKTADIKIEITTQIQKVSVVNKQVDPLLEMFENVPLEEDRKKKLEETNWRKMQEDVKKMKTEIQEYRENVSVNKEDPKMTEHLKKMEEEMQASIKELNRVNQILLISGTAREAKIKSDFEILRKEHPKVYQYSKCFYWTMQNTVEAYQTLSTGIVGQAKQKKTVGQQIASAVSHALKATIGSVPFVGSAFEILDKVVGYLHEKYKNMQAQAKIDMINNIIVQHRDPGAELKNDVSLSFAEAGIALGFKRMKEIESLTEDLTYSEEYWRKIESLIIKDKTFTTRVMKHAYGHVTAFIQYVFSKGESIKKDEPLSDQIVEIILEMNFSAFKWDDSNKKKKGCF